MLPQRKRNRLLLRDYSRDGKYFITVCTQGGMNYFGEIYDGKMIVNAPGKMIQVQWETLPEVYPSICVDHYQIMPNHIHGIIEIKRSPYNNNVDLSNIIRRYKSITTNLYITGVAKYNWPRFSKKLWQRGFHDRVIRNSFEFDKIKQYIKQNPQNFTKT